MERSDDYRKFAEECLRLAKQLNNGEHKAVLDRMAKTWLELAAEAEKAGAQRRD